MYYSLFLLFILVYCLTNLMELPEYYGRIFRFFKGNIRFIEPVTLISYGFYIYFVRELVDFPEKHPKAIHFINSFALGLFIYSVLYYLIFPWIDQWERQLFVISRIIIFPLSLIGMIWLYKKISYPIRLYFLIGSLSYFVGSLVATLIYARVQIPEGLIPSLTAPAYFELGILFQSLFFALVIGQRVTIYQQEKQKADQALIEQLEENQKISERTNNFLENEISRRLNELIEVREELEEREKEKLKTEYDKNLLQSEIRAKRAQVNPHFIYNSLSVLKYLIQQKDHSKAINYLVGFSRLVRSILEENDKVIPLNRELEYLKIYLELEKVRFNDDFNYQVQIEDPELTEAIPIPPLLLQPLAEKAIWDGLLVSEKSQKALNVFVGNNKDGLVISVLDNGDVKRVESESNPNPYGLELTRQRIELFNRNSEKFQLTLNIRDIYNKENILTGTLMEVRYVFLEELALKDKFANS